MNCWKYIYDTSVKIFHSSEAGLISLDGYIGYLIAFIYTF